MLRTINFQYTFARLSQALTNLKYLNTYLNTHKQNNTRTHTHKDTHAHMFTHIYKHKNITNFDVMSIISSTINFINFNILQSMIKKIEHNFNSCKDYIHICMYLPTWKHLYMYIHTHTNETWTYISMYACTHTCTMCYIRAGPASLWHLFLVSIQSENPFKCLSSAGT
jgi:hypothetical protein